MFPWPGSWAPPRPHRLCMKSQIISPRGNFNQEMLSCAPGAMQYYLQDGPIALTLSAWKKVTSKRGQTKTMSPTPIGAAFLAVVSSPWDTRMFADPPKNPSLIHHTITLLFHSLCFTHHLLNFKWCFTTHSPITYIHLNFVVVNNIISSSECIDSDYW